MRRSDGDNGDGGGVGGGGDSGGCGCGGGDGGGGGNSVSGGGDGDSGVCKSSDRSYLRDNLSAIVSNLTPHCVHIHSSVADRMIHLLKVLTRRIRWAGRRAKEISLIKVRRS